jgi:hypothetical protein
VIGTLVEGSSPASTGGATTSRGYDHNQGRADTMTDSSVTPDAVVIERSFDALFPPT